MNALLKFVNNYWNAAIEILLLTVAIYYAYLYFRGTLGAKVLTGLAIVFISLTLVSQVLNLTVISWLLRSLTAFLAIALVVVFQPELRRCWRDWAVVGFSAPRGSKRPT
jgi:diadenylate cyclase